MENLAVYFGAIAFINDSVILSVQPSQQERVKTSSAFAQRIYEFYIDVTI